MIRFTSPQYRNRSFQILLILLTIIVGLISRTTFVLQYIGPWLGDVLYAVMVYWGFGFVLLKKPILWLGLITVSFCFAIEFGQMLNQPWLVNLRETTLGGLILGSNFKLLDILMYGSGTIICMIYEALNLNKR